MKTANPQDFRKQDRGDEMDDKRIIDLYFKRDENAISETDTKYGKLLNHIAFGILNSSEDAEECVDDTYLKAWQSIPPTRPSILSAFLSKITRNLSINSRLGLGFITEKINKT